MAVGLHLLEDLLNHDRELWREELVGLVHDEHGALREVEHVAAGQVEHTARRADEDVHRLVEAENVVTQVRAAGRDHDLETKVLAEGAAHGRCLESKFAGRDEQKSLDLVDVWVDPLERWNDEGRGLACAVLGASQDISPCQRNRDGLFLDGRRLLELRHTKCAEARNVSALRRPEKLA